MPGSPVASGAPTTSGAANAGGSPAAFDTPLILWTDGSASPNPGPGGYAVLLANAPASAATSSPATSDAPDADSVASATPVALGAEKESSNIRMEGSAMIAAIKYAAGRPCEIHSDSEFWINVLTKWAPVWAAHGWTKKTGKIKNLELVQELYQLYLDNPVKLVWVRGHAGTELNELADHWANEARHGATLPL